MGLSPDRFSIQPRTWHEQRPAWSQFWPGSMNADRSKDAKAMAMLAYEAAIEDFYKRRQTFFAKDSRGTYRGSA